MRPSPAQVQAARALLQMTQTQLARAAGIGESTLNAFEGGKRTLHDSNMEKIKDALERRGIVFTNGDKPGVYLDRSKAVIPI